MTKQELIELFQEKRTLSLPEAQKYFSVGYGEIRKLFNELEKEDVIKPDGALSFVCLKMPFTPAPAYLRHTYEYRLRQHMLREIKARLKKHPDSYSRVFEKCVVDGAIYCAGPTLAAAGLPGVVVKCALRLFKRWGAVKEEDGNYVCKFNRAEYTEAFHIQKPDWECEQQDASLEAHYRVLRRLDLYLTTEKIRALPKEIPELFYEDEDVEDKTHEDDSCPDEREEYDEMDDELAEVRAKIVEIEHEDVFEYPFGYEASLDKYADRGDHAFEKTLLSILKMRENADLQTVRDVTMCEKKRAEIKNDLNTARACSEIKEELDKMQEIEYRHLLAALSDDDDEDGEDDE